MNLHIIKDTLHKIKNRMTLDIKLKVYLTSKDT